MIIGELVANRRLFLTLERTLEMNGIEKMRFQLYNSIVNGLIANEEMNLSDKSLGETAYRRAEYLLKAFISLSAARTGRKVEVLIREYDENTI
jgi:hypothetical protein